MKKVKIIFFSLLMFLISSKMVYAVCDTKALNDLNAEALKVQASYELKSREIDNPYGYPDGLTEEQKKEYDNMKVSENYYEIYISNVTDNMDIKVYDDVTDKEVTYNYSQAKDGIISFVQNDYYNLHNYTITVYSSSKTGDCQDKVLYTKNLITPYYNRFSSFGACSGNEEFYLCHQYLNVKVTNDESEFYRLVGEYENGKVNSEGEVIVPEEKKENSLKEFIKKNKVGIIITASVVVIGGGIVTVILLKKKRERK